MNFRRVSFYALATGFFISLALALYTVSLTQQQSPTPLDGDKIELPERQVNRWVAHQSPFFFAFDARPTSMLTHYPFTQDYGSLLKVNSQGFRTAEYTTARPPDTFRIAVLGNQITAGSGVTMEETYTHLTSGLLKNHCPATRVEMINLGLAGHRFADNVIKLFVHAEALQPDLVIFQLSISDIDFYKYFALYEIRGVENVSAAYDKKRAQIFDPASVDWRVFAQGVKEIATWSKNKAVPVLFLIVPPINTQKSDNWDAYNPAIVNSSRDFLWTDNVIQEIRKYGLPTLYLLQTFREKVRHQYLGLSEASADVNAFTHYVIARSVAAFLKKSGLFSCGPSRQPDPEWEEERKLRQDAADHWSKYNRSFVAQLTFYEKLKELHPHNLWIVGQLADAYYLRERYLDALHHYESMGTLSHKYAAPWCQIAFSIGRGSRANEFLERALHADPDQTLAMSYLSDIYLKNKQFPAACKLLSRLMEIPGYVEQYETSKKLYASNGCFRILAQVDSTSVSLAK